MYSGLMTYDNFEHPELSSNKIVKIVFTSFSKKLFYFRAQISAFVLIKNCAPFNPYMNFDYNLSGTVDKRHIRIANNTMIGRADELWVFGDVSDGVLTEIYMARKSNKKIRFFIPNEKVTLFQEISIDEVKLEDVSAWMWEYVLKNQNLERWHPRLRFNSTYPLLYPAYSKKNFYWQMHISKFCIEKRYVPLNPFMLFRYFLSDMIDRDKIYQANAAFVKISDQLWTFGEISNGVAAEFLLATKNKIATKNYKITDKKPDYVKFQKISTKGLEFEEKDLAKLFASNYIC